MIIIELTNGKTYQVNGSIDSWVEIFTYKPDRFIRSNDGRYHNTDAVISFREERTRATSASLVTPKTPQQLKKEENKEKEGFIDDPKAMIQRIKDKNE